MKNLCTEYRACVDQAKIWAQEVTRRVPALPAVAAHPLKRAPQPGPSTTTIAQKASRVSEAEGERSDAAILYPRLTPVTAKHPILTRSDFLPPQHRLRRRSQVVSLRRAWTGARQSLLVLENSRRGGVWAQPGGHGRTTQEEGRGSEAIGARGNGVQPRTARGRLHHFADAMRHDPPNHQGKRRLSPHGAHGGQPTAGPTPGGRQANRDKEGLAPPLQMTCNMV